MEILILGPENAGKTLLLRKIKEHISKHEASGGATATAVDAASGASGGTAAVQRVLPSFMPRFEDNSTVPTVGVDVVRLNIPAPPGAAAATASEVVFREVGGVMSSRWDAYLDTCGCLMFVVDVSDVGSAPTACVLLSELIASARYMKDKKKQQTADSDSLPFFVLLLLNKADLACEADFEAYVSLLGLEALQRDLNGWFYVMAGSAMRHPASSLPPVHSASEVAATLGLLGLGDAVPSDRSGIDPAASLVLGRRPSLSAVVMDDYLDAQAEGRPLEARIVDWVQRFFVPWRAALARSK